MSTLLEIEDAIAKLPDEEFRMLLARMKERDAAVWDRQIEADAESGKLDALYARLTQGESVEDRVGLDEVLDDPKFS